MEWGMEQVKCSQQCAITYAKYSVDHISDVVFWRRCCCCCLLMHKSSSACKLSTMSDNVNVCDYLWLVWARSGKYSEWVSHSVSACWDATLPVSLAHFLITPQFAMCVWFVPVCCAFFFCSFRFVLFRSFSLVYADQIHSWSWLIDMTNPFDDECRRSLLLSPSSSSFVVT